MHGLLRRWLDWVDLVQVQYAALDAACLLMLLDQYIACAPPSRYPINDPTEVGSCKGAEAGLAEGIYPQDCSAGGLKQNADGLVREDSGLLADGTVTAASGQLSGRTERGTCEQNISDGDFRGSPEDIDGECGGGGGGERGGWSRRWRKPEDGCRSSMEGGVEHGLNGNVGGARDRANGVRNPQSTGNWREATVTDHVRNAQTSGKGRVATGEVLDTVHSTGPRALRWKTASAEESAADQQQMESGEDSVPGQSREASEEQALADLVWEVREEESNAEQLRKARGEESDAQRLTEASREGSPPVQLRKASEEEMRGATKLWASRLLLDEVGKPQKRRGSRLSRSRMKALAGLKVLDESQGVIPPPSL